MGRTFLAAHDLFNVVELEVALATRESINPVVNVEAATEG
jgi:hypothetical protein